MAVSDVFVVLELALHTVIGFVLFFPITDAFELLFVILIVVEAVLFFFTRLFILIAIDAFVTRRIFFNAENALLGLGSSVFEADLFCLKFGTYTSF